MRIAVLMTCYNRVETTLTCLRRLRQQPLPDGWLMDVWLVDDASPDKTGERVRAEFPDIKVVQGEGDLFWCKGMALAWDSAAKHCSYDAYLWLNDDAILYDGALAQVFADWESVGKDSIIVGAFTDPTTGMLFYGASDVKVLSGDSPVESGGRINGNLVLIPRKVYDRVGGMSKLFTHQYGDHEYGIRARRAGFRIFVSRRPVGECVANHGYDKKAFANLGFLERLRKINHPKYYGLMDYCRYKWYAFGVLPAALSFAKGVLVLLWPKVILKEVSR